uniref:Uncharacterized protein n=1 Tax=Panstrongylus lignarius TaxID=156445 RepID=A0A224XKK7_9HEMI
MKFKTFIMLQGVSTIAAASLTAWAMVVNSLQSNGGDVSLSVSINSTVTSTDALLPVIVFMLNAGYERAMAAADANTSENGQTTTIVSETPEELDLITPAKAWGRAEELCLEHLFGKEANVARLIYKEIVSAVLGCKVDNAFLNTSSVTLGSSLCLMASKLILFKHVNWPTIMTGCFCGSDLSESVEKVIFTSPPFEFSISKSS